jgi:YD repeat-containing protein
VGSRCGTPTATTPRYDAEDKLLATLRADGSTSGDSREMVRD